jgi:hypothetical protein
VSRPRIITARAFSAALVKAGILPEDAPDRISRIVIDVNPQEPVKMYVEYIADERLLDVALGLGGIEIVGVDYDEKNQLDKLRTIATSHDGVLQELDEAVRIDQVTAGQAILLKLLEELGARS